MESMEESASRGGSAVHEANAGIVERGRLPGGPQRSLVEKGKGNGADQANADVASVDPPFLTELSATGSIFVLTCSATQHFTRQCRAEAETRAVGAEVI